MALSELAVKNAKAREKLTKLSDGAGLQLWIFPTGAKRWRYAFRSGGKQKLLALGTYPDVKLKDAREKREAAKRLLAEGRDPSAEKKIAKAAKAVAGANTFNALADEWPAAGFVDAEKRCFMKPEVCDAES